LPSDSGSVPPVDCWAITDEQIAEYVEMLLDSVVKLQREVTSRLSSNDSKVRQKLRAKEG
jgi:hypothetical protein